MGSITEVLWYDGDSISPLESKEKGHAFKWILAEKDGQLLLIAMPKGLGIEFHKELRDAVCALKGWDTDELKVLGGGVQLGGDILHKSTYFGPMPPEYRQETISLLGLN